MHAWRIAALLCSGVVCFAPRSAAQQPPAAASTRTTPQGVLVDFQDADIRVVIAALAEAGGINIVHAALPATRITLRLRQPVPVDSLRPLLRSIVEAQGLVVSEAAGVMRIEAPAPPPPAPAPAPAPVEQPQLYIYRLLHARAARLAATLQAIFGGGDGSSAPDVGPPTLTDQLRAQQIPPLRLDTLLARRAMATQPPTSAPSPGSTSAAPSGELQIVPEESTNSLLVRATPSEWATIEQTVRAIDVRPLQVLIEVLIAEVRHDRGLDMSVAASVSHTPDGAATPNVSGQIGGDVPTPPTPPSPGELILRLLSGGDVKVDAALSILASRGDVRILSRPVLLAQNNQEAHILIGSQRPFVQVIRSLPTDQGVLDQVVQYRDVGTSLTILPTVNPDGYVNLQLTQQVSAATNETQFGAPVISTREASTFLFVRDGQTAVIGGLVDRQSEHTRTGLPLLIDIPGLGALFGTTHNTSTNTELFLFLTPHIVQSDEDVDRMRNGIEQRVPSVQKLERKSPPVIPPDSTHRPPSSER